MGVAYKLEIYAFWRGPTRFPRKGPFSATLSPTITIVGSYGERRQKAAGKNTDLGTKKSDALLLIT
jgi:hypothetical protein